MEDRTERSDDFETGDRFCTGYVISYYVYEKQMEGSS